MIVLSPLFCLSLWPCHLRFRRQVAQPPSEMQFNSQPANLSISSASNVSTSYSFPSLLEFRGIAMLSTNLRARLGPSETENRQGEALYRVRIVDTRSYPRLHADDDRAKTRPNVLMIGAVSNFSLPDCSTPIRNAVQFPTWVSRGSNASTT